MKDYFSHDYNSRNDKKLVNAFMKFGLESIGAYWCIVEMLYEEGGYLLLSEYDRITFELRSKSECIKYLIYDSELFKNDGLKFWSETAINRLKLRTEKSEKARKSIESRWNRKNNTNVLQSNNERNTSKEKESKEKEIKINEIEFNVFDEFRKEYLGTKRGNETEFKNFTKHKDWKIVLPTLKNCLITQIEQRKKLKDNGKFVPEWKNLQTWINQRCWEEEYFFNENKVQTRRGNNIPKGGW